MYGRDPCGAGPAQRVRRRGEGGARGRDVVDEQHDARDRTADGEGRPAAGGPRPGARSAADPGAGAATTLRSSRTRARIGHARSSAWSKPRAWASLRERRGPHDRVDAIGEPETVQLLTHRRRQPAARRVRTPVLDAGDELAATPSYENGATHVSTRRRRRRAWSGHRRRVRPAHRLGPSPAARARHREHGRDHLREQVDETWPRPYRRPVSAIPSLAVARWRSLLPLAPSRGFGRFRRGRGAVTRWRSFLTCLRGRGLGGCGGRGGGRRRAP